MLLEILVVIRGHLFEYSNCVLNIFRKPGVVVVKHTVMCEYITLLNVRARYSAYRVQVSMAIYITVMEREEPLPASNSALNA